MDPQTDLTDRPPSIRDAGADKRLIETFDMLVDRLDKLERTVEEQVDGRLKRMEAAAVARDLEAPPGTVIQGITYGQDYEGLSFKKLFHTRQLQGPFPLSYWGQKQERERLRKEEEAERARQRRLGRRGMFSTFVNNSSHNLVFELPYSVIPEEPDWSLSDQGDRVFWNLVDQDILELGDMVSIQESIKEALSELPEGEPVRMGHICEGAKRWLGCDNEYEHVNAVLMRLYLDGHVPCTLTVSRKTNQVVVDSHEFVKKYGSADDGSIRIADIFRFMRDFDEAAREVVDIKEDSVSRPWRVWAVSGLLTELAIGVARRDGDRVARAWGNLSWGEKMMVEDRLGDKMNEKLGDLLTDKRTEEDEKEYFVWNRAPLRRWGYGDKSEYDSEDSDC